MAKHIIRRIRNDNEHITPRALPTRKRAINSPVTWNPSIRITTHNHYLRKWYRSIFRGLIRHLRKRRCNKSCGEGGSRREKWEKGRRDNTEREWERKRGWRHDEFHLRNSRAINKYKQKSSRRTKTKISSHRRMNLMPTDEKNFHWEIIVRRRKIIV